MLKYEKPCIKKIYDEKLYYYKHIIVNGDDYYETIGGYETEERAKEVLQEIIKEYKATEAFKACANRISDKVGAIAIEEGFSYEMPLE
jgi:hypothetical protein